MICCKNFSVRHWGKILNNHKSCQLNRLISNGNIKIPNTTAIFNMSSGNDCPSNKLGLCKAKQQGVKCYALKAERSMYPLVLPYRRLQEKYWENITAKEFVSEFILLNAMKEKPFTKIRFNESGDFHDQYCVNKAEEIAKMLRRFGIRIYCYTSRNDLDFSKIKHLIVNGSNFKKKGISNVFRIVKNLKERRKGESICKGNCRECHKCTMKNLNIIIKKH